MGQVFTATAPSQYQETIQRSKFIGNLIPVSSMGDVHEIINSTSSKYRDSTHNCWAYAVGIDNVQLHSSDAGEPSGTAGKPMEGILRKYRLTNVVIVISRYYGGVQLGIRGLMDAYSRIAEETVKAAQLKESVMKDFYDIELSYKRLGKLKNHIRNLDAEILNINYGKEITLTLCIRTSYNFKEYLDAEAGSGELTYEFVKQDVFL